MCYCIYDVVDVFEMLFEYVFFKIWYNICKIIDVYIYIEMFIDIVFIF